MPYKSSKIDLKKQIGLDRRVKLTVEQKQEICLKYFDSKHRATLARLGKGISRRDLAKEYGVSRRTIVFTLYPERLVTVRKHYQERGGWKAYYNKEAHRKAVANLRNYKQSLYLKGVIRLP